jgi:hypothetical protein
MMRCTITAGSILMRILPPILALLALLLTQAAGAQQYQGYITTGNGFGTSGQCLISNGPIPNQPTFQSCSAGGTGTVAAGTPSTQIACYTGITTVAGCSSLPSGVLTGSGIPLTVCAYAATLTTPCGDGYYAPTTVTSTAGSPTITVSPSIPASYIGANIVVAGIGPQGCSSAAVSSPGSGYVWGDTITLSGGTETANCVLTVQATQVATATVVSGGTGCAGSSATITGTTGNSGSGSAITHFQGTVSVSGGAITGTITITSGGVYAQGAVAGSGSLAISNGNPTNLSVEPVTGDSCVGATVAVTMGVEQAVPTTAGAYSVVPSSPVSQGSTSGAGTGAAFTMGFSGTPLATTIANSSGSTVTLGANATTGVTTLDEFVGYGHDDTTTVTAAFAAGVTQFVPTKIYSFYSPLTLTSFYYDMDCQGATLIALAPMTEQLIVSGSSFWPPAGSVIEHCKLAGIGQVTENILHDGANVHYNDVTLLDATTQNLLIAGGSALTNQFKHVNAFNSCPVANSYNPAVNIQPVCPNYFINNSNSGNTDNQFLGFVGAGATLGGIIDNSYGSFYDEMHPYQIANGPNLTITNGLAQINHFYSDAAAPGQPGFLLQGGGNLITTWVAGGGDNRLGVLLSGVGSSPNQVSGGICRSLPNPANCVINTRSSGVAATDVVTNNVGASYSNITTQPTFQGGIYAPLSVPAQGGVPLGLPPSGFFANNGVYVIGQAPASSATLSTSGTSGSVTCTFSAATLLGNSGDNGRIITVLDTTYKQVVINTFSSTTVAACTPAVALSGTGPFANNALWLSAAAAGTSGYSTPFLVVYPSIYLRFPVNVISASTAAGEYYATCQLTTVCTAFNNLYTNGTAAIPATPTAFSTTGTGAFSQTTGSDIQLFSLNIIGGSLGTNGELDVDNFWTANNNSNTKTTVIAYGVSSIADINMTSTAGEGACTKMFNQGATNVQFSLRNSTNGCYGTINTAYRATIDSTQTQILAIEAETTVATDWMVLEANAVHVYQH